MFIWNLIESENELFVTKWGNLSGLASLKGWLHINPKSSAWLVAKCREFVKEEV